MAVVPITDEKLRQSGGMDQDAAERQPVDDHVNEVRPTLAGRAEPARDPLESANRFGNLKENFVNRWTVRDR